MSAIASLVTPFLWRFGSACTRAAALASATLAVPLAPASPSAQANSRPVVIRNVRLFDGSSVVPLAIVIIRDGKIAAVGPDVPIPRDAEIIDGRGKTLFPGMIDAHAHVFGDALKESLVFGVTTELDMFTDVRAAAAVKVRQAGGGGLDEADLRSAGTLVTAPKGHGTEYGMAIPTIVAPDEAQAFVDARIAEGSDYIKIIYDDGSAYGRAIPTISKATLAAVIDAAHKRGKLAVVHIGTLRDARDAVTAGADGLVHLFADQMPDSGFAGFVASKKTFVVPTLSVLQSVTGAGAVALADNPRIAPYLPAMSSQNLKRSFPSRAASTLRYSVAQETVTQLKAAGVAILAGTDAPNPGTAHGASMHGELELLVRAGLTPSEALRAATSAPAAAFALKDRGRIAPGLRADLVMVNGDPTTDISATQDIAAVWKLGVQVDRAGYRAALASAKSFASSPPPGSESGLVSDFDDGTTKAAFGSGWDVSTDEVAGGKSKGEIAVVPGGAAGSRASLTVSGTVASDLAYAWAGAMFSPGVAPMAPANLSSKKAIRFWARGDGKTYRIMIFAQSRGFTPITQNFAAGPEWKEYVLSLASFRGIDGKDIMAVIFAGGPQPGTFAFQIDGVRFQ